MTLAVAVNVSGVVMTSSPGPMFRAASATCIAAVQELSASVPGAPRYCENACSNCRVLGPVVIQGERSVATTSWISSSPMTGGEKGRNSRRMVR